MRFAAFLAISGCIASALAVEGCSALLDTDSLVGGGNAAGVEVGGADARGGASDSGGNATTPAGSNAAGGSGNALGGANSGGANAGGVSAGGANKGGSSAIGGGASPTGGAGDGAPGCSGACDGRSNGCCPTDCTGFKAHGLSYLVCSTLLDWDDAELQCLEQQMDLAEIESDTENGSIAAELTTLGITTPVWLGGESEGNSQTLEWADGTVIWRNGATPSGVYTDFAGGQPTSITGSCVQMTGSGAEAGSWTNTLCSVRQAYVCESLF